MGEEVTRFCFIKHNVSVDKSWSPPPCPLCVDSPSLGLVSIAQNTSGLLRGHPLGHLGVELGVELLLLHPLELKLRVKFLENKK